MGMRDWTAISIPRDVYELAKKYYEEHRQELALTYGVRSLSAFINLCIREYCKILGAIETSLPKTVSSSGEKKSQA